MGGDKNKLAERAAQALDIYRKAKVEVENIEKLAQVQVLHMNTKPPLIQMKALETNLSQSQRPLATVSALHHGTGTSTVLLFA